MTWLRRTIAEMTESGEEAGDEGVVPADPGGEIISNLVAADSEDLAEAATGAG